MLLGKEEEELDSAGRLAEVAVGTGGLRLLAGDCSAKAPEVPPGGFCS